MTFLCIWNLFWSQVSTLSPVHLIVPLKQLLSFCKNCSSTVFLVSHFSEKISFCSLGLSGIHCVLFSLGWLLNAEVIDVSHYDWLTFSLMWKDSEADFYTVIEDQKGKDFLPVFVVFNDSMIFIFCIYPFLATQKLQNPTTHLYHDLLLGRVARKNENCWGS